MKNMKNTFSANQITPGIQVNGGSATGGVINIVATPPNRSTVEVRSQMGTRRSPKIDVFGAAARRKFAVSV